MRRLDPHHPGALFNSGVLLVEAGRAAEAEPLLAELVRRAPADTDARSEWALSLAVLGRFDEAEDALGPLVLDDGRCRRLRDALGAAGAGGTTAPAAALRRRAGACASALPQR